MTFIRHTNQMHDDTGGDDWTTLTKPSNESVTSSTSIQDDNDLFFDTEDDAPYEFEALLLVHSPVGGGGPDFKFTFAEGGGSSQTAFLALGVTTSFGGQIVNGLGGTVLPFASHETVLPITVKGHHVGSGGTFKLRWAQNTSDGNAVILLAGSLLRYRRLPT